MNGQTSVDPEIGERVRAAAARLQYRPNQTARNLSIGRTQTIALVVPDLSNPFFQAIQRGLTRAAEADGYSVLVAEAPDGERERVVARDARHRCDAVVLAAPRMDARSLDLLLGQIEPSVLINRRSTHPGVSTVVVDYHRGVHLLLEHLESLGHQDFLYVDGPSGSEAHRERLDAMHGYQAANPRIRVRSFVGGETMNEGYEVAEQVLASGATAVLAFNDLLAYGILARLNEVGVDVPGDLSITGFDDIDLSRFAVPSLTTARQDEAALAKTAWKQLCRRIDAGRASAGAPAGTEPIDPTSDESASATQAPAFREIAELADPEHVVLTPDLVIRDSTGRVPPARVVAPRSATSFRTKADAEAPDLPPLWKREGQDWLLLHGGEALAVQATGAGMSPVQSPRPHLHPVRTLQGRLMTVSNPVDHRHHFGASLTVPDVNGTSYWGGRTFVEGQGPTLLANHGLQVIRGVDAVETGRELAEDLVWRDQDRRDLLNERRRLGAFLLPDGEGWGLAWRSSLMADFVDLTIASPAVHGRAGAGYGGFFWRLPTPDETRILVEDGTGESAAHGSTSPFVIVQRRHDEDWTSLILLQDREVQGRIDPWFVRVQDYVGAASSLAWDAVREVPRGGSLEVDVTAGLLDRQATAADVDLLRSARAQAEGEIA
jgi:LacI family transcriptional regulator